MAWSDSIDAAAKAVCEADLLLVMAGAGFSADSGLPVYNEVASFPAYESRGLDYRDLCDPDLLMGAPTTPGQTTATTAADEGQQLFYGFWGQCANQYRKTSPHDGYSILLQWEERLKLKIKHNDTLARLRHYFRLADVQPGLGPDGSALMISEWVSQPVTSSKYILDLDKLENIMSPLFVYTSNVDGHFQKAGFHPEQVYELHGSVHRWQCSKACSKTIATLPSDLDDFPVDTSTMKLTQPPPQFSLVCPTCSAHLRPNVKMFNDRSYVPQLSSEETYVRWEGAMEKVMANLETKLVILEMGCGNRVPSVKEEIESVIHDTPKSTPSSVTLVRINPDVETNSVDVGSTTTVCIRSRAMKALQDIESRCKIYCEANKIQTKSTSN